MVMTKAHAKRKQDIKSKLMAAVAMLLVSSIMMVSSTYAWFTLSTAPEVKGITTAVGANGNLEMALIPNAADALSRPDFGITSNVGDSVLTDITLKNSTWGNLVDLSSGYGLDMITLYPAALITSSNTIDDDGLILQTPTYGADGRVKELAANGLAGAYSGGAFKAGGYGVRAVGSQSDVSALELAYNNAVSKAGSYTNNARNTAKSSMAAYGSSLVSMAAKHALDAAATYDADDVTVMQGVINDSKSALKSAENAILQYILAETLAGATEDTYGQFVTAMDGATLADMGAVSNGAAVIKEKTFVVNASAQAAIAALNAAKANVTNAESKMSAATAAPSWETISAVMTYLASPNGMSLSNANGESKNVSAIEMADAAFVLNATTLTMGSGSGIYADIADLAGDYEANIAIEIEYQGQMMAKNVVMVAHTTKESALLPAAKAALAKVQNANGGTDKPISDYYGYIIDLAFRTNAAGSKLLLQTEGVDRIYTGNENNQETMGAGSTMTFKSGDPDYTAAQMQDLLRNLKIVFYDTTTGTILANGELSEAEVLSDANVSGYVVDETNGTHGLVVTPATYEEIPEPDRDTYKGTKYKLVNTSYIEDAEGTYKMVTPEKREYKELAQLENYTGSKYIWKNADGTETYAELKADIVLSSGSSYITDLEQNVAKAVSVLVYLDGNGVTNADVSVSGKITGSINLQFASDANLVPMEYSDLKNGTAGGNTPAAPETIALTDVHAPTGYAVANATYASKAIAFQLTKDGTAVTGDTATVTVTVGADNAQFTATYAEKDGVGGWAVNVGDTAVAADTSVTIAVAVNG